MNCHNRLARLPTCKLSISHPPSILNDFTISPPSLPIAHFPCFRAIQQDIEFQDTRLSHTHQHRHRHRHRHRQRHRHPSPSRPCDCLYPPTPPLFPPLLSAPHHTTPRTTTLRRPPTGLFVLSALPHSQTSSMMCSGRRSGRSYGGGEIMLLACSLALLTCSLAFPKSPPRCWRRAFFLFARPEWVEAFSS